MLDVSDIFTLELNLFVRFNKLVSDKLDLVSIRFDREIVSETLTFELNLFTRFKDEVSVLLAYNAYGTLISSCDPSNTKLLPPLKSASNLIKCGALPQAILANTPLNTVPAPICKLINPDGSVVIVWVSL